MKTLVIMAATSIAALVSCLFTAFFGWLFLGVFGLTFLQWFIAAGLLQGAVGGAIAIADFRKMLEASL